MSPWLQVVGRTHPLLVHLPIGLLVALAALELLARRQDVARARALLAGLAALCAVLAASAGWLLGHAPDRVETAAVELHEWLGLSVAGLTLPLAWLAHRPGAGGASTRAYRLVLLATLAVLLPAGHLGATLTHGEDWLLGPLRAAPPSDFAVAPDYARDVAPILQARCAACHDAGRSKGGLALDTPEGLRAGGRDGPVLPRAAGQFSELQHRLQLPADDEDHMPPAAKPQLRPAELTVLVAWLAAGAPLGAATAASAQAEAPATGLPPAADPAAIAALAAAFLHVEPIEPGSVLLRIDAAAVAPSLDEAAAHTLLEPVVLQVAALSLARAPVGDALAPLLARMPQLARLDLGGTRITEATLTALAGHTRLEELILVRTRLSDAAVEPLAALPALRRLHVWSAGLSPDGIARLRAARPGLHVDDGSTPDAAVLVVEPPVVVGAAAAAPASLAPVNASCPVSGKPVVAAFTIVHEGRVIGFCCEKCPSAFWADPAKFAGSLK